MNKIFCSSCGAKIEFATAKPNFCFKCGDPLNALAKASQKKTVTRNTVPEEEEEQEPEEDFSELLTTRKISLNVDFNQAPFTIAQALANPVKPSGNRERVPVPKNAGRKALKALRSRVASNDPIEIN